MRVRFLLLPNIIIWSSTALAAPSPVPMPWYVSVGNARQFAIRDDHICLLANARVVVSLGKDGTVRWRREIPHRAWLESVAADTYGGCIAAGKTGTWVDGGPRAIRFDRSGQLRWTRGYADSGRLTSITVGPSGSVFVAGVTKSSRAFGTNLSGRGTRGFVAKLDRAGVPVWSRALADAEAAPQSLFPGPDGAVVALTDTDKRVLVASIAGSGESERHFSIACRKLHSHEKARAVVTPDGSLFILCAPGRVAAQEKTAKLTLSWHQRCDEKPVWSKQLTVGGPYSFPQMPEMAAAQDGSVRLHGDFPADYSGTRLTESWLASIDGQGRLTWVKSRRSIGASLRVLPPLVDANGDTIMVSYPEKDVHGSQLLRVKANGEGFVDVWDVHSPDLCKKRPRACW